MSADKGKIFKLRVKSKSKLSVENIDRILEDIITRKGLMFGGGFHDYYLDGVVQADNDGSVTEEQRRLIIDELTKEGYIVIAGQLHDDDSDIALPVTT